MFAHNISNIYIRDSRRRSQREAFCVKINHICLCLFFSAMSTFELEAINAMSRACLSMFYDGRIYASMCDKNFNKLLRPHPLPKTARLLWLINMSINFSEWWRQGRSRHERGPRLAEGIHRKGSRCVNSRRWNPTQPSGLGQELRKFVLTSALNCFPSSYSSHSNLAIPRKSNIKIRQTFRLTDTRCSHAINLRFWIISLSVTVKWRKAKVSWKSAFSVCVTETSSLLLPHETTKAWNYDLCAMSAVRKVHQVPPIWIIFCFIIPRALWGHE